MNSTARTRPGRRLLLMSPVYAFLYLPILVLIAFSFNDSKYSVAWKGFTWDWYARLLENRGLMDAALNSVLVAVIAASLATLLGTLAALAIYRYRFRGRGLLAGAMFVVMTIPDIVMGVSLLVLFLALGLSPGFWTLLAAHVTFCLPFVAVTVSARLMDFDSHLIEAALDLGASEYQALRRVVLPLILPAVAAGWLLSFTLSMDDVIVSFFTTGPTFEVLPLRIYALVRLGVKPDVNALSALMFCVTVACVFAAQILLRKKR
jgi:spermidine/putrescine transport system permease protein